MEVFPNPSLIYFPSLNGNSEKTGSQENKSYSSQTCSNLSLKGQHGRTNYQQDVKK